MIRDGLIVSTKLNQTDWYNLNGLCVWVGQMCGCIPVEAALSTCEAQMAPIGELSPSIITPVGEQEHLYSSRPPTERMKPHGFNIASDPTVTTLQFTHSKRSWGVIVAPLIQSGMQFWQV